MAHIHSVYDTDKHFTIDPATRALVNQTPEKACIMQHDHDSERITFDLPAVVEGHRILDCNQVEVHYLNIDAKTEEPRLGLYEVDDLQLSPADPEIAICSWLISMNATQLVGPLYFRVTFKCVTEGNIDYSWSTAIYKGLTVSDGICCTEYVADQYADILAQWMSVIDASTSAAAQSAHNAAASAQSAASSAGSAAESAQSAAVAWENIAGHNTSPEAHADLRLELRALADRINAALDSDDVDLDQLSEIVAYIQSNKALIEAITTSKVSVTDIVDNLVTNVANKPLSAAQGVVLKALIAGLTPAAIGAAPAHENGAGAHNCVYRGKNLGSAVTADQWEAIANGTFDDLFIGDYWTIGGVTYRIAAFDYYYRTGNKECTTHHVTLVPDTALYTHAMNDSNTTTGAYVGSKMYTSGLTQAKTTINAAFGETHILSHRQYFHKAVTGGYASGGGWYDSTVDLMNEQNVYGCKIYGNQTNGTALPDNMTIDKSQYPLFAFRPDLISNHTTYWLRDVISDALFTSVDSVGFASGANASNGLNVRPAFSIC